MSRLRARPVPRSGVYGLLKPIAAGLLACGLLLLLLSCDVIVSRRDKRYNFFDPDREFTEIYPYVDGQADEGGWFDSDPFAVADSAGPPLSVIIMRFDISAIPDNHRGVYLQLYKFVVTNPGQRIRIHPILEDREPLDFFDADQPGVYFDPGVSAGHTVAAVDDVYEFVDLEPLVRDSVDTIRYGLIIFSESIYIDFETTETPILDGQPRLLVAEP